ncbi:MAG TPA: 1-phosphofructokinase family hexose kinase [Pyrinomonadaceae bacterium]|jgi:1-phosphofructokinase family hexose kinase|nr:1-phosphofructokinase family hexose kinase [Pyrinomonadaceae bacterium]
MIICVSANPAIDRRLRLDRLGVGAVNRASSVSPMPGGKAAHVAMAAAALGERVMWVGFLGGASGEDCERGLTGLGIPVAVVKTAAETRTNMEIVEADGTVTEILEPGGAVTERDVERMLSLCRDVFVEHRGAAQVALSGSLPPGCPDDFYAQLTRLAHAQRCRVLLDASGEALRAGLRGSPDLVKPNREEAEALTGFRLVGARSAAEAARALFDAGAGGVAISLGADGMFWQESSGAAPLVARPPRVEARSPVGCGDAALAGFAVARRRGLTGHEFVRFAAACGTANCLADAPGMIDRRQVERLLPQSSVEGA